MSRYMQVTTVAGLAIFWAINWPMMKIALTHIEPWTFRAVVVVIGGLGCLLTSTAMRQSIRVPRTDLRPLLWLALFQGVLWNAFSGFGIAMVEAGRASVLGFTMPVWAILLAMIFLKEPITTRRLLGLMIGMVSMVLLMVPALEAIDTELTGSLLMVAGAIVWAIATIIVKAVDWKMGMLALAGWQFVIGSIPLVIAAFCIGDPSSLFEIDYVTIGALAYSALVPMIFCQSVWFTVVRRLPTSLASTSTLLVPPLGVYFAAVILGETVGVFEFVALVLVIAALLMILPGFNWPASLRPPRSSRLE
ncbi:MAG: DMT family transporter [Paracoccaceae bacterium]|nr:DMT family transporter [Paracoccaceae bacterium]